MASVYAPWAATIKRQTNAAAVLLGVTYGIRGDGCATLQNEEWARLMPGALRAIARDLRRSPPEALAYLPFHEEIHAQLQAAASLMIVFEGTRGTGITVLGKPEETIKIPGFLDQIADNFAEGVRRAQSKSYT